MNDLLKRALLWLCGTSFIAGLATTGWVVYSNRSLPPIRVGLLHSLTGTMAISELPVVDATLLAIEQINQRGGLLGRQIEVVSADGQSDDAEFARQAERLITEKKVHVVFGGWTSASRKSMKPVFEKHKHLLMYPIQYEGLEESQHIVYAGATPNQQVIPAISWAFQHLGKRFFLVGSDYIYPRTTAAIVKDLVATLGGQVVGEHYLPLGTTRVQQAVQEILAAKPTVIINTINGDTNLSFFRQLRSAGISPEKIPTLSFSLSEPELHQLGAKNMAGDYAAWNYFQSLTSRANQIFLSQLAQQHDDEKLVVGDPMESAYSAVFLWAQSVQRSGTVNVAKIHKAIRGQSYEAPHGVVHVDHQNGHTWKTVRIGKIQKNGQFNVVWSSQSPVQPIPYPPSRTKQQWQQFLHNLQKQWQGKWSGPTFTEER
ncbi:MAG: urea ABC transporter substrate-binding protein [Myxococcota bacterium]